MSSKPHKKIRLDSMLFEKGLVESREKAKALIIAGEVLVNGIVTDKAGAQMTPDAELTIKSKMPFVSRGGLKLDQAVNEFNIELKNRTAMDVGASTGGFTDCMLQHGAVKVYAVDVGYGQFDWRLRKDERVVLLEKTNVRYLQKSSVPDEIDIATIDVSFISLTKVIPNVLEFLKPEGEILALIKPQFEAERKDIGKGGVVKDESKRLEIVETIKIWAEGTGLDILGITPSPIKGPKGNVEYLIYMKKQS
jgi:23S rRNA (cytidine1920-2'-O)/16S rRNA (cytidine1409-2'-O)-methyltransferase